MMNRFVNSKPNEKMKMLVEIASNPEKFIFRSISNLLIAELEGEMKSILCAPEIISHILYKFCILSTVHEGLTTGIFMMFEPDHCT